MYADGSFDEVGVFTDINGNCRIDYEISGIWDPLGNNRYLLSYDPDFNGIVFEEIIRLSNGTFPIAFDDSSIWYYGKE